MTTGVSGDDACEGHLNSINGPTLSEMLQRIDTSFEVEEKQSTIDTTTSRTLNQVYSVILPSEVSETNELQTTQQQKGRVGRPRTKPERKRTDWHYHLGGVRHSRVPLSAEMKEVLEVAYVSRVMSKNFRKEGQPEKERISQVTGIDLEKVQEWFKNRRKKERHNHKKTTRSLL